MPDVRPEPGGYGRIIAWLAGNPGATTAEAAAAQGISTNRALICLRYGLHHGAVRRDHRTAGTAWRWYQVGTSAVRGTADLEADAERALRAAAREPVPPDVGHVATVTRAVRDAYRRGELAAALVLAHAYQLFLNSDDLDVLRDALTDLLPADYVAPEPKAEEASRA